MIDYKTFLEIKYQCRHQGLKCSQIADRLGLDERTVEKWLKARQFRPRQGTARSSKLDAFKDAIVRMLETYPYTATQVYQRICEQGFDGRSIPSSKTMCARSDPGAKRHF